MAESGGGGMWQVSVAGVGGGDNDEEVEKAYCQDYGGENKKKHWREISEKERKKKKRKEKRQRKRQRTRKIRSNSNLLPFRLFLRRRRWFP